MRFIRDCDNRVININGWWIADARESEKKRKTQLYVAFMVIHCFRDLSRETIAAVSIPMCFLSVFTVSVISSVAPIFGESSLRDHVICLEILHKDLMTLVMRSL